MTKENNSLSYSTFIMNRFFSGISYSFSIILLFLVCFITVVGFPVLAETTTTTTSTTTQQTLDKTDIANVGMNMFTTAYKWEAGNYSGYQSDSFLGFSKKLNQSILNKKSGIPLLVERCGGCSDIVQDGFDVALTNYVRDTPPELTNGNVAYYNVVVPYLNKKIPRTLPSETITNLNDRIKSMVAQITGQVREQMNSFRDVSGMGLYYDGDTDNSPYDLLDDIRKIDEVFFRESPAFGKYKNTSQADASALITGQIRQGSWVGGGENYNIDLASDIKNALGGGDSGDNVSNTGSSNSSEAAGDCSSGYCITIDFIQSTHYMLGGNSSSGSGNTSFGGKKGDQSLQGIIEEANEWMVKNGDKRNFACQKPPTFFFFQTNNSSNLKLSKIFSGPGIYVLSKLPTLLKKDSEKDNTNQQSKADKETTDIIRARFTAKGLDYDKPTNIKGSLKAGTMYSGLSNAYRGVQNANDVAESVDRTSDYYNQILITNGANDNRALIHEYNKDSIVHLEKTFDEMTSRARLLRQFSEDLNKILKALKDKPYCSN